MTGGVTVRAARAADAEAIARIRVDAWRTTYRGILPDAYLAALSVADNAAFWRRILEAASPNAGIVVAEEADGLCGFASTNRRDPPRLGFDAELSAIYLLPARQRQGIGRRLVATAASDLRANGGSGMIVFVIAANRGARAFYERLGGALLLEQPFEWDGIPLVEVAYGFRDLDALAAAGTVPDSIPH